MSRTWSGAARCPFPVQAAGGGGGACFTSTIESVAFTIVIVSTSASTSAGTASDPVIVSEPRERSALPPQRSSRTARAAAMSLSCFEVMWPSHVYSRPRSEEHTSELQSPCNLVCRLLLEKKKTICRSAKHSDGTGSLTREG